MARGLAQEFLAERKWIGCGGMGELVNEAQCRVNPDPIDGKPSCLCCCTLRLGLRFAPNHGWASHRQTASIGIIAPSLGDRTSTIASPGLRALKA